VQKLSGGSTRKMRVDFGPRIRCYGTSPPLQNSCDGTSPPLQNSCDLPIFMASEVTLHVSARKGAKLRHVQAGWDDATVVLPGEGAGPALRRRASRRGFCLTASAKVTGNAPPDPPPTKTGPCDPRPPHQDPHRECRLPAGWRISWSEARARRRLACGAKPPTATLEAPPLTDRDG
jgi:hypothetical protein